MLIVNAVETLSVYKINKIKSLLLFRKIFDLIYLIIVYLL